MTSQEHFVFASNPLLLSIKIPRQNWAAKSTLIATCEHSTCQAQFSSMKSAESGMRNAAAGSTREHNHQDHCNHPRALGRSDTGMPCPAHSPESRITGQDLALLSWASESHLENQHGWTTLFILYIWLQPMERPREEVQGSRKGGITATHEPGRGGNLVKT